MTFRQFRSEENLNRPWAIVRILPKAQRYVVARFRNRQDADDHLRVLQRFIPAAIFEIVFDPSDETE
jgi:putative acetyltransferase